MTVPPIFPGNTKLTFTPNVRVREISYHTWRAIDIAWRLLARLGKSELTVTSVSDGAHMQYSKHYTGDAFDMRGWDIASPPLFALSLRAALGRRYDVVVEAGHVHVEYDPKLEKVDHGKADGEADSSS